MTQRRNLTSTLWLASSLALLASVLGAPIRTSGFATVPARPVHLRPTFVAPSGQPAACLDVPRGEDEVAPLGSLAAENEEQDQAEALDGPRVSCLVSYSRRKVPDRRAIARRSTSSSYPLRC